MASTTGQVFGFFLGLLGFTGTVVATVLPHWRSTAYVGSNVITATEYMTGLWMGCVWHSTGIYQCELYRSLLALPSDLQAARAFMVLSCAMSVVAFVLSVMGMKCVRFARSSFVKTPLALSGGVCFLCAGLLCLIPVSWTTHDVIVDFYNPFFPGGMKYEIGLAVYIGYASAFLSLSGGAVLCWNSSGGRSRTRQDQTVTRPPAFNNVSSPAPMYKPPEALKDNHTSCFCSLSNDGYRVQNYF